ncbi:hypothetical protein Pcinc_014911 [Petrolisthes cinctipes]|uniref:CUB domain-containing protein n=1 Tax=Petrolisthes cinctipes TaxID=88211 RepID=A0AAE1FUF7_PETCI|nr:hypothetical protein Pcinc_014911 [Petrolisthes cinctipes]
MHIDYRNAMQNYFKSTTPIFEGTYKFIHSPICGPTVIPASTEGNIIYPKYEPYVYGGYCEDVHCIWELRVKQERDVWLYVDQLDFSLNDCSLEVIEVYLPGHDRPEFTICEKGDTAEDTKATILKSRDLIEGAIIIHFKSSAPGHSNFKLTWTELYELPKNSDGTVMTSKLITPGVCEFVCPGKSACINNNQVCNGVRNCPDNSTDVAQHDEAPEICFSRTGSKFNYVALALGAAGGTVVAVAVIILVCRNCRKRPDDNSF